MGASDWFEGRWSLNGPSDQAQRFETAAAAIARCQVRNRMPEDGGAGCPILIEGLKDVKALRALGFIGPIEKMNRGWDRSRLVAFLHDEYGTRNIIDGGPPIILLMDWDRTGGRLQTALRNRLQALDVPIDETLRNVLMKAMKPEGRTVESLAPFASSLMPLILARLDEE
jgi:5S rRNA maturation endonuclease (ribonuclease M5)